MKPKLRLIDMHPIQHQGQAMILLRDPLRLVDGAIAIPRALGPLVSLMDGTRDETELAAGLLIRNGVRLAPDLVSRLVADLDAACLLDNERSAIAQADALRAFRAAPFRPMTVVGDDLDSDPERAAAQLQAYVDGIGSADHALAAAPIRGVISPHIDYQRGGPVYAEVWRAAAEAVRAAEVVVVFGTDHNGSDGTLTLTHQSYATPWGQLPTELAIVSALARRLGEEAAFSEELHHRTEHSIELAAIWLHFVRDGQPVPLVPILCGGFGSFIAGESDPESYEPFMAAVEVLRESLGSSRTLIVAAADLAHVGPAFGDPYGLDFVGRAQLRNSDQRLLAAICAGSSRSFFRELQAEGDRRHVCGLPPIYLTLRLLLEAQGERAGYALCPADPQGLSFVSIAGVILR